MMVRGLTATVTELLRNELQVHLYGTDSGPTGQQPLELRLAPTFDTFRRRLKTYLFG